MQNGWETCAPCDAPCRRLKYLDRQYRAKYHISMMENLSVIRERGMQAFLRQQEEDYRCPACGEIVCVHRQECPSCKVPVWGQNEKESMP